MQRSSNILCVALFVSHLLAMTAQAQAAHGDTKSPKTAFLCRYTDGPRAGRTQQLSVAFDTAAIRAGSSCSDGISSSGVVIELAGATLTSICRFSNGPRAGEIADLAAVSAPVPVGTACSDGVSSMGTAIDDPDGAAAIPWSNPIPSGAAGALTAVSTICQFMSGPKAHGWHDYAPFPPAPLGSPCRDGSGSAGIVMASGHGQPY
jgi:hypothetical protein